MRPDARRGIAAPCALTPARKEGHCAWHRPQVGRRVRRYATVAAAAAIGLLATACGGHAPSPGQAKAQAAASAKAHAAMLAADLKITPSNGSRGVDPSAGISVTALTGKVTNVTVRTSGDAVSGQPERWRQDMAQRAPAGRVAELHGDRHRHPRQRRQDHHDEHLPHPDALADLLGDDLRGVPADLRRRHADHADLQHADHQQGGRRAVARTHHVQAGDRRLVLGRRRAPVLPAAGLLAGRHHGQLRRPPERGGRAPRACTRPPT